MYLSFFELDKKPFQINVDPRFLWMGEKHREALAMLRYGILDNRGFIMLTGDVGTGKTTLVNALISSLGEDVVVANITNPGLKRIEFLNHLGGAFDIGRTFSGKGEFLTIFQSFLKKCHLDGKQVLLIVDEAQQLTRNMLEEIRLLSNIELQNVKLLNIFFVGQDEFSEILDRHENRALRQRMTLQYHLEPLSEKETGELIRHRLKVAGTEKTIFTKNAILEIHAFSEGYPRLINIICDHAMLAGYVSHKKRIDAPEIIGCAKDLRLKKKTASPPFKDKRASAPEWVPEKAWARELAPTLFYSPYIAAVLLILLLFGFLYFPYKAGASFSNIMAYWTGQTRGSGVGESTQITEPPSPRTAFKVGDAGQLDSWAVRQQKNEKGIQIEPGSLPAGQPDSEDALTARRSEDEKIRGLEDTTEINLFKEQPSGQTAQLPSSLTSQPPIIPASEHNTIPDSEKCYTIAFGFDSNDIAPEGYQRLKKTADFMKSNPEIRLTIKGHTDTMGENAYNVMLSKFRADIAKNYLVSNGVSLEKITSVGKGSEEPIADNDSFEGRRMNRRVEVVMSF